MRTLIFATEQQKKKLKLACMWSHSYAFRMQCVVPSNRKGYEDDLKHRYRSFHWIIHAFTQTEKKLCDISNTWWITQPFTSYVELWRIVLRWTIWATLVWKKNKKNTWSIYNLGTLIQRHKFQIIYCSQNLKTMTLENICK